MFLVRGLSVSFVSITGLERQFGLDIDRSTMVKLKKLKFKGRAEPTIMRKKKTDADTPEQDGANKENDPLAKFPYPYEAGVTSEELAKKKAAEVSVLSNGHSDVKMVRTRTNYGPMLGCVQLFLVARNLYLICEIFLLNGYSDFFYLCKLQLQCDILTKHAAVGYKLV